MWVVDHLSTDASADFAVDLANIVRETDLGGSRRAELDRFVRLVAGLIAYTKDRSLRVYGIADGSLLRDSRLIESERQTLRRWRRNGLIEVLDVADGRLIELADGSGMRVVSRDSFKEFHRPYPWLSGNTDRFFWPQAGPGGTVTVRARSMPYPPEHEISFKEEEGLLLARGLIDRRGGGGVRRDLLTRRWSCPQPDCPLFGVDRSVGQPLPDNRSGTVRCPTHRVALADLGSQPRRVQVKLRVDGEVLSRFVIEAGTERVVGRAPGAGEIVLPQGAGRSVSRRHVVLAWDGEDLTATDVSSLGTEIKPTRGARFKLTAGRPRRLRRGEVVVLSSRVELLVSGRVFALDESEPLEIPDEVIVAAADERTEMSDGA